MFLVAEWRQHDPMLDLTLFRRPAMVGVSLVAFTIAASIFALFLYLTLYIQDDLGYGPFAAGLRFLPITVLAFLVAPIAGKLTRPDPVPLPARRRAPPGCRRLPARWAPPTPPRGGPSCCPGSS